MSKKNSRVLDDLLNKGSITPILINKNNTLEIAYEKAEGVCAAHRNGDPTSKWFYEFQCKPKDKKDLDKIYRQTRSFNLFVGENTEHIECFVEKFSPLTIIVLDE